MKIVHYAVAYSEFSEVEFHESRKNDRLTMQRESYQIAREAYACLRLSVYISPIFYGNCA